VNEIIDYLLLTGILCVGVIWLVAVFCFFVTLFGGYDD